MAVYAENKRGQYLAAAAHMGNRKNAVFLAAQKFVAKLVFKLGAQVPAHFVPGSAGVGMQHHNNAHFRAGRHGLQNPIHNRGALGFIVNVMDQVAHAVNYQYFGVQCLNRGAYGLEALGGIQGPQLQNR